MKLKFTKMQACGNDYVYVDCTNFSLVDPSAAVRKLSPRRYSVGSDGLVLIKPSEKSDVKTEIYNADGSRAELCGNALRCVAKYCFERKNFPGDEIRVETDCGEKIVGKLPGENEIRYSAEIGRARFIVGGDGKTIVSLGNPHRTEITDDVRSFDFFFFFFFRQDLYNTDVFSVSGKNSASALVFERGSGETLSCGSGACAIAAYGVYKGLFSFGEIAVNYPGGTLCVRVDENYFCTLIGEAKFVFDGEAEL